jgi:hypothetical protein
MHHGWENSVTDCCAFAHLSTFQVFVAALHIGDEPSAGSFSAARPLANSRSLIHANKY